MQIFDAINLTYGGGGSGERWAEVQREVEFTRRIVKTITGPVNHDAGVLASIRS